MGVFLFLVALFLLVLVHELGHFIVAKRVRMRVDEFGIGFPPKLFGIKRGGTEYTFNLLPIGGFVKIFGEDGEGVKENNSFGSKSKKAQTAVLIAGITANILFAWFLFSVAYIHGVQTAVPEESVTDRTELAVVTVIADSPAAEAGIMPNDRIVRVVAQGGDTPKMPLTPSSVSEFVADRAGEEVTLTYVRGDETKETILVPEKGITVAGIPVDERARVGISMTLLERMSYSIPEALYRGAVDTIFGLRDIAKGVVGLIRDSLSMQANLENIAGPVGIAVLAGDASQFGFSAFLIFTAYISLNLAIINILPLPALDGGRLVMVAIEAIRKKPIKATTARLVNAFGFLFLIGLMIAVTYSDIAKIF